MEAYLASYLAGLPKTKSGHPLPTGGNHDNMNQSLQSLAARRQDSMEADDASTTLTAVPDLPFELTPSELGDGMDWEELSREISVASWRQNDKANAAKTSCSEGSSCAASAAPTPPMVFRSLADYDMWGGRHRGWLYQQGHQLSGCSSQNCLNGPSGGFRKMG